MKRNTLFAVILACAIAMSALLVAHSAGSTFVGANKCKMCHSSAAKGNQFGAWQKEKHANAFTVLTTPKAKEVGAKLGVTDPSTDPKCLKCHTTGNGLDPKMGVQCESCHGAGDAHVKARMAGMKDVKPDVHGLVPAGEIVSKPGASVCQNCHNAQSPTFKSFNFATAVKSIAHPDPRPRAH